MSHPSPRAGASLWLRSLKPGFLSRTPTPIPPDPLRSAGHLLREAREGKALSLRDLSQRTRISIAVLEALEGGWKDRLPEATYLRAMLPLLEQQLDLAPGSLEPVLPHATRRKRGARTDDAQGTAFLPSTLHLLTTWQSTLLYGLLALGLLYAVNLQQRRLAAQGRLVTSPIPLTPGETRSQGIPSRVFPEVHPLRQADGGVAMDLLTKESTRTSQDRSLGVLSVNLSQPTTLDLQSSRSGDTRLEGVQGTISLPVLPPFQLQLSPAPPPGAVGWKGRTLQEKSPPKAGSDLPGKPKSTAGTYAVPAPPKAPP